MRRGTDRQTDTHTHTRPWPLYISLWLCSLPNQVVDVNSVNVFKARLDRFWMDQDVKFDSTADLTGTGDRSVNVISET